MDAFVKLLRQRDELDRLLRRGRKPPKGMPAPRRKVPKPSLVRAKKAAVLKRDRIRNAGRIKMVWAIPKALNRWLVSQKNMRRAMGETNIRIVDVAVEILEKAKNRR